MLAIIIAKSKDQFDFKLNKDSLQIGELVSKKLTMTFSQMSSTVTIKKMSNQNFIIPEANEHLAE